MDSITRGEIWYCDLDAALGSEQQCRRPVLILQNHKLNQTSPTTIVAPITAQIKHPFMQAHCILDKRRPLYERSMVLAEQIRTVDKRRLQNRVGRLSAKDLLAVGQALRFSLGLGR
jgi:mRNA interferase MazF